MAFPMVFLVSDGVSLFPVCFPVFSYGSSMVFLWFFSVSDGFPTVPCWYSFRFLCRVLWFPHGFPWFLMVFPRFPAGFLSYGVPMVVLGVLWFPTALHDVPTFSYGFSWFLIAFPMASCWFSFRLLRPSHGLGVPAPFGRGQPRSWSCPSSAPPRTASCWASLGPSV